MSEMVEVVRAVHSVNGSVIVAPLNVVMAFGSQWVIKDAEAVKPVVSPAAPKAKVKGSVKPTKTKLVPAQDTF